jgi:PAS domain S-box-containing protein
VKQDGSAVRVLIVQGEGLGPPVLDRILGPVHPDTVRARSVPEARELLESSNFDVIIADDGRLRGVLDAIFAFVGLFSLGGVVLDANEAPLLASGLSRDQVIGRRFVDLPWFSHSETARARVSAALGAAGRGESVRTELQVWSTRGMLIWIDASFLPLRDQAGTITHVVGSGVDITPRKQAQDALAASQARLAEAQRVAHIGSWEWTIAENVVQWSDELYFIYAVSKSEFVPTYEGFFSRVWPEDVEHTKAAIQAALRSCSPFVYDHRIRRPDGSVRMLHTRGEVMPGPDGKPARLVGSCWDVTEHWQATAALEHSVSTLTATLNATADGILVGDRHGKVSVVNRRFLAMWRLPSNVGPGADIRQLAESVRGELVEPDRFMAKVAELYGDEQVEAFDVIKFKDGRVFERYSLPQWVADAIVGRVCSFRDVTRRERLFERATSERAAAETARHDLERVLERVSDGFVALDRTWRYAYVNGSGGRLLGRDARELIGRHIWTEFPEGRGQKFQLAYEKAMREQRPIQLRDNYPPWNRWFENRIYPSPDGITIFFNDITDQVMMEDALRGSNDRLRALGARLDSVREEERRVMAREIHDQIGQSLTALKLDLAWLRRQLDGQASPAVAARTAAMDGLIDQIIETARRVSADLRPPVLDDLGLGAAITWVAREVEKRTGISAELRLPADNPPVTPEAALALFRIVQEALTNVVRHAGARHVRIELEVTGGCAVLSIADDGRGATRDELERPTALGVLGMRERALVVGGSVTITGSPGQGTTVTVSVPLAPAAPS